MTSKVERLKRDMRAALDAGDKQRAREIKAELDRITVAAKERA